MATDTLETLRLDPQALVIAHLYASEEAVAAAALRHRLEDQPDARLELAVRLYDRDDEHAISLARAAEIAGTDPWTMREILHGRGVELRLGPGTMEEALEEVEAARQWLHERRSSQ